MALRYPLVAETIIQGIKAGEYPVGSLLPSEPELSKKLKVSRSTVRAALAQLQSFGMIERRPRAGTRVCADAIPPVYVHTMTATGDLLNFGGHTRRQIQVVEDIIMDEDTAVWLELPAGRRWLHIGQTRHPYDRETAICWTDVYIPAAYAALKPQIESYPGLFYTLIEQKYDVTVSGIVQKIRARDIPDSVAQYLGELDQGRALNITRKYHTNTNTCVLASQTYLPSDRFDYSIIFSRQTPSSFAS